MEDYAAALRRRYRLTPRREEIARLMLARLTVSQMCKRTGLSEGTIKAHRDAIYSRLGENTPAGVVSKAYEAWIDEHVDGPTDSSE